MSYDLAVFYTKTPISNEDAKNRYYAYSDDEDFSEYVEPSPAINEFVAELTAVHPQIDDVEEEKLDDCPWSCAFDLSEGHVLMSIRFSMVEKAYKEILRLSIKYGLVLYDPQDSKIVVAPQGINLSQKPWWKFW